MICLACGEEAEQNPCESCLDDWTRDELASEAERWLSLEETTTLYPIREGDT